VAEVLIVVLPGIGGSVLARPGEPERVVWDAGKGDVLDLVARPARMSLAEWPVLEPVGLTKSTKLLGFTIVPRYERLLAQLAGLGRVDEHGIRLGRCRGLTWWRCPTTSAVAWPTPRNGWTRW
jgi:hypothetical protein